MEKGNSKRSRHFRLFAIVVVAAVVVALFAKPSVFFMIVFSNENVFV